MAWWPETCHIRDKTWLKLKFSMVGSCSNMCLNLLDSKRCTLKIDGGGDIVMSFDANCHRATYNKLIKLSCICIRTHHCICTVTNFVNCIVIVNGSFCFEQLTVVNSDESLTVCSMNRGWESEQTAWWPSKLGAVNCLNWKGLTGNMIKVNICGDYIMKCVQTKFDLSISSLDECNQPPTLTSNK